MCFVLFLLCYVCVWCSYFKNVVWPSSLLWFELLLIFYDWLMLLCFLSLFDVILSLCVFWCSSFLKNVLWCSYFVNVLLLDVLLFYMCCFDVLLFMRFDVLRLFFVCYRPFVYVLFVWFMVGWPCVYVFVYIYALCVLICF